jgi:hypothetical protein
MHPYTNPYDPSKHPSTTTHHSVKAQNYPHIIQSRHRTIHTSISQGTELSTHHSVKAQNYPHINPSSRHLSIHAHSYVFTEIKRQSRDLLVLVKFNWQDQNLPCFPAHMPSVRGQARALCNPTCISLSYSLLCLCTLCKINHINISSLIIAVKNVIINNKRQIKAASIHCLPFHFSIPSP